MVAAGASLVMERSDEFTKGVGRKRRAPSLMLPPVQAATQIQALSLSLQRVWAANRAQVAGVSLSRWVKPHSASLGAGFSVHPGSPLEAEETPFDLAVYGHRSLFQS